jgi:hypothetical protein
MKITVKSSGGFAGLPQQFTVDTAQSTAATAEGLTQMIHQLDFFKAAANQSPDAIGADMMRWQISMQDNGRTNTISFVQDGTSASEPWKALLDQIIAAAQ